MNRGEMVAAFKRRLADRSYCDADIVSFLNEALMEIAARRPWSWLRKTHTWPLTAAVEVTDCTATANSQMLTTTSTFPSLMMGRRVVVGNEIATIVGQNANTQLVASSPFYEAFSGTVTVLYDQLSLPRGATGVLSSVRLDDSVSAFDMVAVSSRDILRHDHTVQDYPREYAVVQQQQFPQPQIAPPTPADTSSGSGPLAGTGLGSATYRYWYSYLDRETGWESSLSPYVEVTITNNNAWDFTLTRGTPSSSSQTHVPQGFHVRVYRSKANGTVPHFMWTKSELLSTDPGSASFSVEDTIQDAFLGEPADEAAASWALRLWPSPSNDSRVEIVYESAPRDLASDEDTPPFGAQFHPAVVDLAVAVALEAAGEVGRADQKRMAAERLLRRMDLQDRPSRDLVRGVASGGGKRSIYDRYPRAWEN